MTGLSAKKRKDYYNLCEFMEPLSPDDPRNIDFDNLDQEHPSRGRKWVDFLAEKIELSKTPTFMFFSGLPGSGKSTELKRLMQRLQRSELGGANLLPVYIDAEEVLDLTAEIEIPDIIANVVHAVEMTLLLDRKGDPNTALKEGYLSRFLHWLKTTDVNATDAKIGITKGTSLTLAMKLQESLRTQVRKIVAKNLNGFLRLANAELEAMNEQSKSQGYEGIVVIFDSLERLQGMSINWHEVLFSAERLFFGGNSYLKKLPIHILYTIPPALAFRHQTEVEFLPMIKLKERDGKTESLPGLLAARELIRCRIPDEDLSLLFGEAVDEQIKKIIESSGGYPREIIRTLKSILHETKPGKVATERTLNRILQEIDDHYRSLVPAQCFGWLAKVAITRFLTEDKNHQEEADRMLSRSAILRYRNDATWFNLHPSLFKIPGIRAAISEQKANKQDPMP